MGTIGIVHADRLRERGEPAARARGGAAAGAGRARGARRRTRAHRPRAARRERAARTAWAACSASDSPASACTFLVLSRPGDAAAPERNRASTGERSRFTFVVSLLSGLLFGLVPALKYAGPRISTVLRGGGRTASESRERHRAQQRARRGAGRARARAARQLRPDDSHLPGAAHRRAGIHRSRSSCRRCESRFRRRSSQDAERVARLQNDIVDKLAALPGVTSVAFASVDADGDGVTPNWDAVFVEGTGVLRRRGAAAARCSSTISPRLLRDGGHAAGRRAANLRGPTSTSCVRSSSCPRIWLASSGARRRPRSASGSSTLPVAPWREVIGVVAGRPRERRRTSRHRRPSIGRRWARAPTGSDDHGRCATVTFAIRSPQAAPSVAEPGASKPSGR